MPVDRAGNPDRKPSRMVVIDDDEPITLFQLKSGIHRLDEQPDVTCLKK